MVNLNMNYCLVNLELSCNNKKECPSVMGILFTFSLELSCNKTAIVYLQESWRLYNKVIV